MEERTDRTISLDIFRILCCFGVLSYHSMSGALSAKLGMALYYGAAYCIPGFFMLSGFLVAQKKVITVEYAENKIKTTLQKFFGWCAFWTCFFFFFRGTIYNPFHEFFSAMQSGGIMPVGWFLFTYCFLIFFSPYLKKWIEKSFLSFAVCVCILLFLLALRKFDFLTNSITQSRWLHLYLTYFMLGMALKKISAFKFLGTKKYIVALSAIFFLLSGLYYAHKVILTGRARMPHQYYGSWYYTIWLVSLFMLVFHIKLSSEHILTKPIKLISRNTFSIYMAHLPILRLISEKMPVSGMKRTTLAWGGVIILCIILSELFRRLPLLRKIV